MDIRAGIQTAVVMVILGILLTIWAGIQSIRSARKLDYFRLRQRRIAQGWQLLVLSLFLAGGAYWLGNYGEPLAYQYYPPSPMPSLTGTITPTPTISLTPTISPTPTISNTPAISNTPTATSTPFMPMVIEAMFSSSITPNPDAIFSPLIFARDIDLQSYEPIDEGTVFENPIKRIVTIYSYDQMIPGVQWTALWYRDDTLVHYETSPWDGTTGGYGFTEWAPDPSEWLPAEYTVQIFVGLEWKSVGRFIVEGNAPTPKPSPRPSVTITPTKTLTLPVTPSLTPTPVPTLTPAPSNTRPPTSTRKPSSTPAPTDTSWPSATPSFTRTPTSSRTPTPQ